jgi:hypothetical protein
MGSLALAGTPATPRPASHGRCRRERPRHKQPFQYPRHVEHSSTAPAHAGLPAIRAWTSVALAIVDVVRFAAPDAEP